MVTTLTAVLMFSGLSFHESSLKNDFVGKYAGKIFVDESVLPANAGGNNEAQHRKSIANLQKTKGTLELLPNSKFTMIYSCPDPKTTYESYGTWSRRDDQVTLTFTGAKGKTVKKAITQVLRIRQEGVLVHDRSYGPNSMTVFTKAK